MGWFCAMRSSISAARRALIVSSSLKTFFEARVDDHQAIVTGSQKPNAKIVRIVAGR